MSSALIERTGGFVRQSMLGTEAVYEILEAGPTVVTAEVVHAPGLVRGTRLRLMRTALLKMDRCDLRPSEIDASERSGVVAPVRRAGISPH